MSVSQRSAAGERPRRGKRARLALAAVLVFVVGGCFAATELVHRTEVLSVSRVEAHSDDTALTVVAAHNDCGHDPTARVVDETADAVTVRAERRRDVIADSCYDVGELTPFPLSLTEPLGDRTIVVDAPYRPDECIVDDVPSDRCVTAGP